MSTTTPAAARTLADELATHGIAFLDAPVSGGVSAAESGTLTVMVGDKAADLERARPILASLAPTLPRLVERARSQWRRLRWLATACWQPQVAVDPRGLHLLRDRRSYLMRELTDPDHGDIFDDSLEVLNGGNNWLAIEPEEPLSE